MFTSAAALLLALSGSWVKLAVVSSVTRLVTYVGVSAATLRLRSPRFAQSVPAAGFLAPLGPIVPIVAMVMSLGVAAGATREQLLGGAMALVAGALLYVFTGKRRGRPSGRPAVGRAQEGPALRTST
jgi:amino acid transporter